MMEKIKTILPFTYMLITATMLGIGGLSFVFGPTYRVNFIGVFMVFTGILMVIPLHIIEYLRNK